MKTRTAFVIAISGIVLLGAIEISNRNTRQPAASPVTPWHVTGILLNDSSPYLIQGNDGNLYRAQWTGGFSEWKRGFAVTLARTAIIRNGSLTYRDSMFAATNAWQSSDVVFLEIVQQPAEPTTDKKHHSTGKP
jgi:hypothetical protein